MKTKSPIVVVSHLVLAGAFALAFGFSLGISRADETCSSPYMARIEGQEDFVYVWTLGVEGLGDGMDKLVTVDAKPGSPTYGKIINTVSVEGRNEAHHGGFTDDRRQLWLAGLENSKLFIFDVHTDPAKPKLMKTIGNFAETTGGAAGPHGAYALPGRVLIPCLSNAKDKGGRTALVEYGNDANYRREVGKLAADPEAMKNFGATMVLWDFHARQPKKIFQVPGAPLEIRWAWGDKHNYAFTATALTSKLWLVYEDEKGEWQAKDVAPVGDVKGGVLPVNISISSDDNRLFVDSFGDGKCRVFDISDPQKPKQIYEKQIGKQLNMVSQSWDGKRLYFTSSVLARWDKQGENNEQFLRAYNWDGKELKPAFDLDFNALKLGRPHHMLFGAKTVGKPPTAVASN